MRKSNQEKFVTESHSRCYFDAFCTGQNTDSGMSCLFWCKLGRWADGTKGSFDLHYFGVCKLLQTSLPGNPKSERVPGYSSLDHYLFNQGEIVTVDQAVDQKKSLENIATNSGKTMASDEHGTRWLDMVTLTERLETSRPGRYSSQNLRRCGWNRVLFGKWAIVTF